MKPKKGQLKQTRQALKKASPTILSILGVIGVVTTAVLAVKATPKALERIEDAKEEKKSENGEKLTRMETVAACWQCYIPAAATGIATIGCIMGANILNRRQQASLASAYALTQNVDPNVYLALTPIQIRQVASYINDPMTATTISSGKKPGGGHRIITSELIYYWMIFWGIPFECQKWHLNRLLTLIRVCGAEGGKPEKIPKAELIARNRALNAERRKRWNTRG